MKRREKNIVTQVFFEASKLCLAGIKTCFSVNEKNLGYFLAGKVSEQALLRSTY